MVLFVRIQWGNVGLCSTKQGVVCVYIYTRVDIDTVVETYIYIWSEREISLYSNGETDMYM